MEGVEDLMNLAIGFTWGPVLAALVTCIYGAPLIFTYGLLVGLRAKWNAVRMTVIPTALATPFLVVIGWWIIARDVFRELWETGITTLTSYDRVMGTALFLVCCPVMFIFWSIAIGAVVTLVRSLRLLVARVRARRILMRWTGLIIVGLLFLHLTQCGPTATPRQGVAPTRLGPTEPPFPTATPTPTRGPIEVPLATVFVGWYGYNPVTGECQGGIGSTHWNDTPNTAGVVHTPYRGFYCSADSAVVSWQLEQMKLARIQVILFSWWGWGDTDLDGMIEGHGDQHMNSALTEFLDQIRATGGDVKVAVIVEPFTQTQAGIHPSKLTLSQKRMVLDYLWERYYSAYASQMFHWHGKPLIVVFDPMMLPDDPRYTIRHWTGRAKSQDTEEEGWQWTFAPPQDVVEAMSDDGVVFVYPRYDEYYAMLMGADYITWEPRRADPLLEEGIYERQWQQLAENGDKINLVIIYGWNLYGEQAHIEPSGGGPAPVGHDYVNKTRDYYNAFLEGRNVEPVTGLR